MVTTGVAVCAQVVGGGMPGLRFTPKRGEIGYLCLVCEGWLLTDLCFWKSTSARRSGKLEWVRRDPPCDARM